MKSFLTLWNIMNKVEQTTRTIAAFMTRDKKKQRLPNELIYLITDFAC